MGHRNKDSSRFKKTKAADGRWKWHKKKMRRNKRERARRRGELS